MAIALTITGKAGPGNTITAQTYSNLPDVKISASDNAGSIVEFTDDQGLQHQITCDAATTVTATKSGNVWTLTIS